MSTASIEEKKNTTWEKDAELEEKPALSEEVSKPHICYDKGTLLELRASPASQFRPATLQAEFLNVDGVWDPEAWHISKASRTSSPMVDQKVPDGKKKEQMDDGIELAPHRRSFRQGCHVSVTNDGPDRPEKYTRPMFEKKSRLTGRASGQRKNMETNYREHGESSNSNYGEYDKSKRERYGDKENRSNRFDKYSDKENRLPNKEVDGHFEKDKYGDAVREQRKDREKENHPNERKSKSNRNLRNEKDHHEMKHRREEENLPEWMTDGPTSQLDTMEFTGFQDIEDEKKAYAKTKKKVRISPDVEVQQLKSVRRSSTPQKSGASTPTSKEEKKEEADEKPKESSKSPNFDITEFFSEVNFYPPRLFHDDIVKGNGIRSRFTQYFQTKSRSNSHSSDGGVQRQSPAVPTPYFTPIQPASPVPMVAPVTSAIVSLIQEKAVESIKTSKEIKGRHNVEQVELHENNASPASPTIDHDELNQSAFDLLVQSMKEAGQLPDKPAPVVTGLPDHLLPQPPRKSSPTFEKLRRSLSRSPSPAEFMKSVSTVASILVSNPAIEAEMALKRNPVQILHPSPIKPVSPEGFHQQKEFDHVNGSVPGPERTPIGNHSINSSFGSSGTPQAQRLPTAFLPTSVLKKMHSEKQRESPSTVQQQPSPDKSPLVNGHNDSSFSDLLVNSVRSPKPSTRENHHESEHALSAFDNLSLAGQLNLSNIDTDEIPFHSAPPTPRHSINAHPALPPHSNSAPNTPEHRFCVEPPAIHRVSMQPPGLGSLQNPSFGKNSQPLMVPSAFQAPTVKQNKTNDFGAIGSGIPQKGMRENDIHGGMDCLNQQNSLDGGERRGFADPRLAPGNGVIRNTRNIHSPVNNSSPPLTNHSLRTQMQSASIPQNQSQPSQQQQLLQAQRMAQIHQAQLHQQQKLQQIANQAKMMQQQKQASLQGNKFNAPTGVRPLLPDPDPTHLQQKRNGEQQIYQQQQRQQIQAYHQQQQRMQQQQMQQQQQPRPPSSFTSNNNNSNNNNNNNNNANGNGLRGRQYQNPEVTRNSPPMPMPLQQPGLQAFQNLNRPQGIQNVNLAAQALVQQQLLNQAARARFIAQTQLLQQQPQVMHALMAQAALVRGQAQAQAAMMFNQKNLQAMAEQMGIRPPLPHLNNKHIPTPMINTQNNPAAPGSSVGSSQNQNVSSSSDGLSKWFGKDILNLLPQNNPPPTELTTGKVLSVEELERKQRSS